MEIPSSSYIFQESDFEDDPNSKFILCSYRVPPFIYLYFCIVTDFNSVFHPSAFVGKYRKGGFSLETLREQLQSYSSSIKQNLFVIINRDYKDFITIATSVCTIEFK